MFILLLTVLGGCVDTEYAILLRFWEVGEGFERGGLGHYWLKWDCSGCALPSQVFRGLRSVFFEEGFRGRFSRISDAAFHWGFAQHCDALAQVRLKWLCVAWFAEEINKATCLVRFSKRHKLRCICFCLFNFFLWCLCILWFQLYSCQYLYFTNTLYLQRWAVESLLVMLSLFSQTHLSPGEGLVWYFHAKIMFVMIISTTWRWNNFFLDVFASAFGPRCPKGGSSHLWLKRFSLSLQKQIQHLQLMSGGSHMKAFGKFKTGKKK